MTGSRISSSIAANNKDGRFATLTFERNVAAPVSALWQAWIAPAARSVWAPPVPSVSVEFLETDTRVGGREVSLCKVDGQPDIRCECGWLDLQTELRSVNYEVVSCQDIRQSAALITADFNDLGERSLLEVTVQLSSLSEDMRAGYSHGFSAGLDNLATVAARTMILQKVIAAPRTVVWNAWFNPETLPLWWGPQGYSCRTKRIDLRQGGEWVFDMIGPEGTVYPNHHLYRDVRAEHWLAYTLLWGENGPKHADAWASFEEVDGATQVTLGMVFSTVAEFHQAKAFGAIELGLETLGKLGSFVASQSES